MNITEIILSVNKNFHLPPKNAGLKGPGKRFSYAGGPPEITGGNLNS
jgi:hypothetical protein